MARPTYQRFDRVDRPIDPQEKYEFKDMCPHVSKGVDIAGLMKTWMKKDYVGCHVCKNNICPRENAGYEKDLWICLNCSHVGCGINRSSHGYEHFSKSHSDCHSMIAVVDTWALRCLLCRLNINLKANSNVCEAISFLGKYYAKLRMKSPKEKKIFPVLGLENLGNTCYMNAVLQCLAQTPNFVNSLEFCCRKKLGFHLSGGENLNCHGHGDHLPPLEGVLRDSGQLTKALFRILYQVISGAKLRKIGFTTENPSEVIRILKKCYNTFNDGEQHDSHELLRFLLEGLRAEDLKRYQGGILRAMNIRPSLKEVLPLEIEYLIAYKNQATQYNLVVEQIFGGSLVSILKCLDCSSVTATFESFMDISLPVESEKMRGIEKAPLTNEVRISKYQQKKERKMARRSRKKLRVVRLNAEAPPAQTGHKHSYSSMESGTESEADVEDNTDAENTASISQDDRLKTVATPVAKSADTLRNHDGDLPISRVNKDGTSEVKELYPYALMLFDSNQDGQLGQAGGQNVIGCEKKICDGNCSPEFSVADHDVSPELSAVSYGISPEVSAVSYGVGPECSAVNYGCCIVENSTVAGVSGSSERSLNEDFGSCDGGRGSTASSIEQADWEEDEEEKKGNISVTLHYETLVQKLEKAIIMSPEPDSGDIPPPEAFEFPGGDNSLKDDAQCVSSLCMLYENFSGRCSPAIQASSFSVSQNPEKDDKERVDDDLTPDVNHLPLSCNAEEEVISDELLNVLVEEVEGSEKSDGELLEGETGNGALTDRFSSITEPADGKGGVWGTTLAPPSELESVENSLEHCLRQFFNEELLSGKNRIGCEHCTRRTGGKEPKAGEKLVQTNAMKQLLFVKLPEVLTIHLKRFEVVGSRMSKITRKVSFPLVLDVSPYTSVKVKAKQPDVSSSYQLYGVIEHSGHLSSGHYVAYVKVQEEISGHGDQVKTLLSPDRCEVSDPLNVKSESKKDTMSKGGTAKWYFTSDTFVKEVNIKEVLAAEAYLLFYRRIE
ncbi:ubiquitin carboxyl-terminal hydrolase 45 isoform X2 [Hetaerina americana]|uniref:ubiquitin carboxyl-terminal hydrolase 45 isoform X2 n=1 Tax=Hetaerina americana TaxID=62018 RepID=UPI003A7F6207